MPHSDPGKRKNPSALLPFSQECVIIKKDIKISILGKFPEEVFYFNKKDYNEIIKIISSNLPVRTKLNIK